jgi:UDP-N-acetylglucosamine/UDP-N-acetyl-alpha-D-glucosaminouronate 4-epimerase
VNVLVTGGAGFIGSHLVRSLAATGERVRVLDDLSTGSLANLADTNGMADVTVGDIRDEAILSAAMDGVEVVYHMAALPSVIRSIDDPVSTHSVNVDGTLAVLEAARKAAVKRVVYASSSSIYGDAPTLPKHEEMPPAPLSPYAAAKLSGETYCRVFAHVYGLQTVSLRFFNVFGPKQDPASEYAAVIPRFIDQVRRGERITIFGDGKQSRDFTFVANAVQACVLAGAAGPDAAGEVINVACGDRISLLELVEALGGLFGARIDPVFSPPRQGDVRHSLASIEKAERLLGYRPLVSVRDGLAQTVEWLVAQRPAVTPAT